MGEPQDKRNLSSSINSQKGASWNMLIGLEHIISMRKLPV
jgi:hypothetical protein